MQIAETMFAAISPATGYQGHYFPFPQLSFPADEGLAIPFPGAGILYSTLSLFVKCVFLSFVIFCPCSEATKCDDE